jgi:hypothetical protein
MKRPETFNAKSTEPTTEESNDGRIYAPGIGVKNGCGNTTSAVISQNHSPQLIGSEADISGLWW